MKYVCKKSKPEYQESPLFMCGYSNGEINVENEATYDGMYLIPDPRCYGIRCDEFEAITEKAVSDLMEEWDFIQHNKMYASYYTLTETLNALCGRADGKSYTTKQVHEWKDILNKDGTWKLDNNDKCTILTLVFGGDWDWTSIHGCCQGDYAEVFYQTDMWSKDGLDMLEIEYFNLGSEWSCDCAGVEDIEEDEATEADITDPVYVYAYSWDDEDIRQELADSVGCDKEDIIMIE